MRPNPRNSAKMIRDGRTAAERCRHAPSTNCLQSLDPCAASSWSGINMAGSWGTASAPTGSAWQLRWCKPEWLWTGRVTVAAPTRMSSRRLPLQEWGSGRASFSHLGSGGQRNAVRHRARHRWRRQHRAVVQLRAISAGAASESFTFQACATMTERRSTSVRGNAGSAARQKREMPAGDGPRDDF